jgi:hypothetical protein
MIKAVGFAGLKQKFTILQLLLFEPLNQQYFCPSHQVKII